MLYFYPNVLIFGTILFNLCIFFSMLAKKLGPGGGLLVETGGGCCFGLLD